MDSEYRGLRETCFGRAGRKEKVARHKDCAPDCRHMGSGCLWRQGIMRNAGGQKGRTITMMTTTIIIRNGTSFSILSCFAVTLEVPRSMRLPT